MRTRIVLCAGLLLAACGRPSVPPAAGKSEPAASPPASTAPGTKAVSVETNVASWPDAIASLEATRETPITAMAAGFLVKQNYADGARVKGGEILFTLDPHLSHGAPDAGGDITVPAPGDGMPSRAQHGPGDWIPAGELLATLETCDPIAAHFELPSGTDTAAAREMNVRVILPDGSIYAQAGSVAEITRGKPGGFAVTAIFTNPDGQLRPGQYVRVRATPARVLPAGKSAATWR